MDFSLTNDDRAVLQLIEYYLGLMNLPVASEYIYIEKKLFYMFILPQRSWDTRYTTRPGIGIGVSAGAGQ